jgi:hypothetical protein
MQRAVRSYLTTGIALVGAGVIVASPIAVAPPDVQVPAIHASAISVDLAAAVNPITEWVQVLQTSFNNIAVLGQQVQSDPAPILQQFITNQLANVAIAAPALEQALGGVVSGVTGIPQQLLLAANQLAAGNFSAAVTTVFQTGLGLVLGPAISLLNLPQILTTATQNFANVVAAVPNLLLPIGLAAISPLAGAVNAFGTSGQEVIDGLKAGDVGAAISAIVNAPAAMTDAILNGIESQGTLGILSPSAGQFSSGLIAALLNARDTLAQALGAPVPPPPAVAAVSRVAKPPTAAATTVTLSTAAPRNATSGAPALAAKTRPAKSAPGSVTTADAPSTDKAATSTGSASVGKHRATGKSRVSTKRAGQSANHSAGAN